MSRPRAAASTKPSHAALAAAHEPSIPDLVVQRWLGTFDVDEWGLDHDVASVAQRLAQLRWRIDVQGAEQLPPGGALLVHNRRLGWSEPLVVAAGVRGAAGRLVRFAGVPDIGPVASLLGRVGGVPATAADVRSLFRAGELVSLPLQREVHYRSLAGSLDPSMVALAIAARVPVVPVAVLGYELGRRWRVIIGEPMPTGARRNALAAPAVAARATDHVQALLRDAA
jgi:hypothetical protein